ncbi:MAG: hypothetical protein OEL75_02400 [Kiritimatiellaceae bacterium]|nr:hypothetical protein [Kiritimatiellaceae bacterium]
MKPNNQSAWLWWVSVISISIGIAVFIFLKPAEQDYAIDRIRNMSLFISFLISGLCIIIGTRKIWFGKDL